MFSSIRFCFISPPRLSYISDSSEQYDDDSDSDHVIFTRISHAFYCFAVCTSWILSPFFKRKFIVLYQRYGRTYGYPQEN